MKVIRTSRLAHRDARSKPPRLPGEHDGEQDAGRGEEDDDQPHAEQDVAHRPTRSPRPVAAALAAARGC